MDAPASSSTIVSHSQDRKRTERNLPSSSASDTSSCEAKNEKFELKNVAKLKTVFLIPQLKSCKHRKDNLFIIRFCDAKNEKQFFYDFFLFKLNFHQQKKSE